MSNIEIIVLIITGISWYFTWVKVREKHTSLRWNLAPFGIGFTTCLWIANIFGG
jgi:hypothetical protein